MVPLPKIPFVLSRHSFKVIEMLPLLILSTDHKIKCVLLVQIQINMCLFFLTFTRNNIQYLIKIMGKKQILLVEWKKIKDILTVPNSIEQDQCLTK